jgi:uncharacterized protein (TIGR00255 family)
MAAIYSMTGFARMRHLGERGEMVFTVKGVNHRGLDAHLHLPADLEAFENPLRTLIKQKVARGRIDFRLIWNRASGGAMLCLNRPLLESWLAAMREASESYNLAFEPDLNIAMRLPGMLGETGAEPDSSLESELLQLASKALDQFNQSRQKEGAALAALLAEANGRILKHASEMAVLRSQVLPVLQERLRERMTALLNGTVIDSQRILQETALVADRGDISEEIQRLTVHGHQLQQLLAQGGEIGKRLDFLMQEMGRETNTILSKTSGAGEIGLRVTDLGIAVKTEIERIREQSLNLE